MHTAPSGYPSNLRIIAKTLSSITFQWNKLKCHQENGPIIGYEYRIYHDLFHYIKGTVNQHTTMFTVYETQMISFSVAAINVVGTGEHCPLFKLSTSELGVNITHKVLSQSC